MHERETTSDLFRALSNDDDWLGPDNEARFLSQRSLLRGDLAHEIERKYSLMDRDAAENPTGRIQAPGASQTDAELKRFNDRAAGRMRSTDGADV